MTHRRMRTAAVVFSACLALSPAAVHGFETADQIPFPSRGAFPAWEGDPLRPWSVFAYGGLMYDSNALRRSTNEQSDIVARYGVGGRTLNRIMGRQRLLLEGFGEYYDFDRFSEIDHFGYGLRGDLLWEIGNDINGAVAYARRRQHADLGEFRSETRVMSTTDRFIVDGGYRFAPDWRVFAGAEHISASRDSAFSPDLEVTTVRSSLTYGTPLGNRLAAEVRGTRGDTRIVDDITLTVLSDKFEEREVAAILVYGLTGQVRVDGRLGHTTREYDTLQAFDFSGGTYRGRVEWLPTQKLIFSVSAYRQLDTAIDIDASHVVRRGASFGASWAPTFKLVFTARFVNDRLLYQGDPAVQALGIAQRDETLRVWRFGAGWEPQRRWQVGAGIDVGERTSNRVGRDYDYTQVMLNVRWTY